MEEQRNIFGLKLIGLMFILTLIFLFYTSTPYAQNRKVDSLKVILQHSKEDTSKVNLLCGLANEFYFIDLNQSSSYAKEGILLAEKLNWKKGEIMGGVCLMFNQMAERNFSDAISTGFKILRLAETENDTSALIQIYYRLGGTYRTMYQYDLSEEYHMKALLLARKYNNELKLLKPLVTLDMLYTEAKRFDKAEKYAAEALPMAIRLKDEESRLLILQMSALRKHASGNIREAINLYAQVIEGRKEMKQYNWVVYLEGELGTFYADLQMKDSAFYFVNAALELSKRKNLPKELNDSYQSLYYISKSFHDYENALKYHLIADSLDKARYTTDVMIKTERERFLLQEKKAALAKAEIQKQKTVRNFTFAGALGLLAFGGYAFYNYRRRRRFEKQQELSEERLRISRELHDDIGSTLGSIAVYSDVAKRRSLKNESPQEVLSKIGIASRELIEKMGDIIWNLNPENESFEQLNHRMQSFASMILTSRNIDVEYEFDEELKQVQLTAGQRKNLFLIYKETVHNIVKHSEAANVGISIKKSGDFIELRISDDGKGFDIDHTHTLNSKTNSLGGNGLTSMASRAKDMIAAFKIESKVNEGTKIELSIKV